MPVSSELYHCREVDETGLDGDGRPTPTNSSVRDMTESKPSLLYEESCANSRASIRGDASAAVQVGIQTVNVSVAVAAYLRSLPLGEAPSLNATQIWVSRSGSKLAVHLGDVAHDPLDD